MPTFLLVIKVFLNKFVLTKKRIVSVKRNNGKYIKFMSTVTSKDTHFTTASKEIISPKKQTMKQASNSQSLISSEFLISINLMRDST
jgi:hypothetical protein